jgi:hypothetical protein
MHWLYICVIAEVFKYIGHETVNIFSPVDFRASPSTCPKASQKDPTPEAFGLPQPRALKVFSVRRGSICCPAPRAHSCYTGDASRVMGPPHQPHELKRHNFYLNGDGGSQGTAGEMSCRSCGSSTHRRWRPSPPLPALSSRAATTY